MGDIYFTADEAAEYLRLAPGTLANRRRAGAGPPFLKFGAKVVYRREDLDSWAESKRRITTADVQVHA